MRTPTRTQAWGLLPLLLTLPALSNDAHATLGFDDVTVETGVDVQTNSYWGAGIAFLDWDGDTDLDLYVVDGEGDPNVFFRNDGNRQFSEIANQLGLDETSWGKAVVPADIDNDGDADLLLTSYSPGESNRLFRNDGGTYVDITAGSGFDYSTYCTGAAWADYDGDTRLDCYITTYAGNHQNRLLRNLGGGVFQDVAASLGVQDNTGWGYQPAWFDYDFDGDPDLYVGNDDFFGGTPNKLYRNNGDGTFTDVSVQTGAGVSVSTMGLAIGDFDNDLDLDIYMSNLPDGNVLLRNDNGVFTDVTDEYGVAVNYICWGVDFFDGDNDGWLDLYANASDENGNPHDFAPGDPDDALTDPLLARGGGGATNAVFHNDGGNGFTDVSFASGAGNPGVSYCSAIGDYDSDGDLDVYVTNLWFTVGDTTSALYENSHVPRGSIGDDFLRVNLIGTVSNRDAVGTKVWIETAEGFQLRERQAGTGYLSSSEPTLHFGLGSASTVDRLLVLWPSGLAEEYVSIPAGTTLTLIEGDGLPTSVDPVPGADAGLVTVFPNPLTDGTEIRFQAPDLSHVRVEIHDVQGRFVRSLEPSVGGGSVDGGVGVIWDRRDALGQKVAAGSYFVRVFSDGRTFGAPRVVVLD